MVLSNKLVLGPLEQDCVHFLNRRYGVLHDHPYSGGDTRTVR